MVIERCNQQYKRPEPKLNPININYIVTIIIMEDKQEQSQGYLRETPSFFQVVVNY